MDKPTGPFSVMGARDRIDFSRLYIGELRRGDPTKGFGFYERGGGLKYYSDGRSAWFFERGTGRPAFRLLNGTDIVVDGNFHEAR